MMDVSYSLTVMKGGVRHCGATSTDLAAQMASSFALENKGRDGSFSVNLWKVRLAF